jgi:hypothetical protein
MDGTEVTFDALPLTTVSGTIPTVPYDIYLGMVDTGGTPGAYGLIGDIYSFKIWKDGELVRDLVPAARYTCGPFGTVEYGFIDHANSDTWYSALGAGALAGSPELNTDFLTSCAVNNYTPYNFADIVESDMTLFARWEKIPEPSPTPDTPSIPNVPNTGLFGLTREATTSLLGIIIVLTVTSIAITARKLLRSRL